MMTGPNLALVEELALRLPEASIQASGGVSSVEDVRALAEAGASGAIVGKALWDRKLDLAAAIEAASE
jgi:phosphoribosylformimino-5-aminoimidazole carboxamide ribotide isomerase